MAEKKQAKEKAAKPRPSGKKAAKAGSIDSWAVLRFPHTTEKSIGLIEKENTLVFIVDRRSSKKKIKEAVEKAFDVKVDAVRTSITQKNYKKAFVKLGKDNPAGDIAIRLGII